MNTCYKKLQNGSDIRGIAIEGVAGEVPNLTVQAATDLTEGFLLWLAEKTGKAPSTLTVSVGRDSRLSGPALERAVCDAFLPYGVKVLCCGLASTPAMFMSTVFEEYNCDGAIMITASHLPFNRNGFKYFDKEGGLNKEDIAHIIDKASSPRGGLTIASGGACIDTTLIDTYSAHLRKLICEGVVLKSDNPLEGLKIVVDAGNGAGGFFAAKVLAPLGADVADSQFLDPDGNFPNHAPNPEDKEAMTSVSERVKTASADFGIIFDTDVDRSAAVDGMGREIARNRIVAMASVLASEKHPGTTIVTDSITSDQLNIFLTEKLGLCHLRFKRGYKNVINKAIELNLKGQDCHLAIETSGHAAFKDNYFLDDGAYLATLIVIKAANLKSEGKRLDSLIADLEEPAEAREVRFPLICENFGPYGDNILEDLKVFVTENNNIMSLVEPNYEGVRIRFTKDNGDGWCLLRKSLHDPIMPFNLESNTVNGTVKIAELLQPFFHKYKDLDTGRL